MIFVPTKVYDKDRGSWVKRGRTNKVLVTKVRERGVERLQEGIDTIGRWLTQLEVDVNL